MNTQSLPSLPVTDEPTAVVIDVTPELARVWLRANTRNRKTRDRAVTEYARDMAAGHWNLNGEAIKFSHDGSLLDGQHRLRAVVESDTTVQMLVVVGLPAEAQETMDTGRKRTTGDVMGLRGEANAHTLAAVLRRVYAWDQGDKKFSGSYSATNRECAQLLAEQPNIRRSAEIAVRTRHAFPHIPQSVLGTAHHLFSRLDAETTAWFFERIGDGASLPLGHPVLALRARVTSERLDSVRMSEARHMAYRIRTWNAVREGRSLDRLVQPPNSPMPLPK
ncbi:MAG: hypothetical protein HOV73_18265 [Streptomyces sp.]|nr:hypothetical protein [Streptomyces sp.]NUR42027.1 hypothetical protein [Streptomyces sp.]NUS15212.1 hypothetical protein [Streptomyces sp.]NUS25552.1 hypothetical protein [Streptomyces sp.]NUS77357.1 hypothetical protein [Streptomyces sp.]